MCHCKLECQAMIPEWRNTQRVINYSDTDCQSSLMTGLTPVSCYLLSIYILSYNVSRASSSHCLSSQQWPGNWECHIIIRPQKLLEIYISCHLTPESELWPCWRWWPLIVTSRVSRNSSSSLGSMTCVLTCWSCSTEGYALTVQLGYFYLGGVQNQFEVVGWAATRSHYSPHWADKPVNFTQIF